MPSISVSPLFLAVSFYLLDRNPYKEPAPTSLFPAKNPYKGSRKLKDEDHVSAEVREQYVERIINLVLYDAENCQALKNFEPIMSNTHCIFAKKSVVWGAKDYDTTRTVGKVYIIIVLYSYLEAVNSNFSGVCSRFVCAQKQM